VAIRFVEYCRARDALRCKQRSQKLAVAAVNQSFLNVIGRGQQVTCGCFFKLESVQKKSFAAAID
jgi:hypothetical protein